MPDFSAFCAFTMWGLLACFFGGMHPESAFGAIGGSFFFMTLPQTVKGFRSVALWLATLSTGYGSGLLIADVSGWGAASFLTAAVISAIGGVFLTALAQYLTSGPLPEVLEKLFDAIPFIGKKRGGSDA